MKNTEKDEMKRRRGTWETIFWYYNNLFKEIRILRNEIKRAIERYQETGEEKFRINGKEITSVKELLNLFYEVEFSIPNHRLHFSSFHDLINETKELENLMILLQYTRKLERPDALRVEIEEAVKM